MLVGILNNADDGGCMTSTVVEEGDVRNQCSVLEAKTKTEVQRKIKFFSAQGYMELGQIKKI